MRRLPRHASCPSSGRATTLGASKVQFAPLCLSLSHFCIRSARNMPVDIEAGMPQESACLLTWTSSSTCCVSGKCCAAGWSPAWATKSMAFGGAHCMLHTLRTTPHVHCLTATVSWQVDDLMQDLYASQRAAVNRHRCGCPRMHAAPAPGESALLLNTQLALCNAQSCGKNTLQHMAAGAVRKQL